MDSINRLGKIIRLQSGRLRMIRKQSVGCPSQTLQLEASMKDVLFISKDTLRQLRYSAEHLEIAWAMLEE